MRTLLQEFGELLVFIIVALGIAANYAAVLLAVTT